MPQKFKELHALTLHRKIEAWRNRFDDNNTVRNLFYLKGDIEIAFNFLIKWKEKPENRSYAETYYENYQVYTYRGLSYTFPMRLYDPKKVAQKIVSEYDGKNASELARKYGYSLRWVLEALRKARQAK